MEPDHGNNDSLDGLLSAIGRYPQPAPADELRLVARAADGDAEARRALIEARLGLVVSIAAEHLDDALPLADAIQEGVLGLIGAVDTFDPRADTDFPTYAGWWIRKSILGAVGRAAADAAERLGEVASPEPAGDGPIIAAFDELHPRAQRVLELRFGLAGDGTHSRAAIGRELGVSIARVREIERQSLYALRATVDDSAA